MDRRDPRINKQSQALLSKRGKFFKPMKYKLLFLLCILLSSADAQSYLTRTTAKGKALKWYESAKSDAYNKQYEDASKTLKKLLASYPDFIDAQLLMAQIQFDQQAYDEAAKSFEQALAIDSNYDPRIYYMLGMNEWQRDQFSRAASYLEEFIESNPRSEKRLNRAKRFAINARFAAEAIKNPVPYTPQPLSNAINSERPEYAAAFTVDENTLIFTRRVINQNTPRPYVHEDFYISRKDENGNWQTAQALLDINTPYNEGGHSISADGKFLVYTACDYKNSKGGCDIYFTEKQANGIWTKPQSVGVPINTRVVESLPSLSADGRTMVFASNREGTRGNKDLWVANRRTNGTWSNPRNLGKLINTPFDEDAPFLHPDGQTLYFMSDGHPGMGGSDLYYSRLQADGNWGTPINLGYPINTKGDEGAFSLSFDGKTAYFASDKKDLAKQNARERDIDIFTFEMPPAARPQAVTYVRAKVRDAATQQLLSDVQVSFTRLSDNQAYRDAQTDVSGEFLTILPSNKNYALSVDKQGYLFHSEHFALVDGLPDEPFELEINLIPIPETPDEIRKETPVVLNNVFFKTGSADLLTNSQTELNRLRDLLNNYPKLHIQINGHTDNVGNTVTNQSLSEARAKAVYGYLLAQGITAERLRYKGFGETMPIASNETETGRRKNRRTEFVVVN